MQDEYFTAHGDTALLLADRYYKTRDIVTYPSVGDQKGDTAQLVIRPQKLPAMLRDILVERRESVEIYRKNKDGAWSLWKKGSPGNLQSFEDMLSGGWTNGATAFTLLVCACRERCGDVCQAREHRRSPASALLTSQHVPQAVVMRRLWELHSLRR